jgi:hypothetical protein
MLFANLANQFEKVGKDCPDNAPIWLEDAASVVC